MATIIQAALYGKSKPKVLEVDTFKQCFNIKEVTKTPHSIQKNVYMQGEQWVIYV